MVIRNLDGAYFRVERDGKWMNLCFTDLTDEDREKVTAKWGMENWKRMALILADALRCIGDAMDLSFEE